jgi:ATP-dependent DNA ligase
MHDFGKPQKAKHLHLDEKLVNPKHVGKTYLVMEKFDGWFMYIDCIDGVWQGIRSKTGRRLKSMEKYSRMFDETIVPKVNVRLIFEAVIPEEGSPRGFMVFKDCNGRFNQEQVELQNVVLKCHDLLIAGKPIIPFETRYTQLSGLVVKLSMNSDIPLETVSILSRSDEKADWMRDYDMIVSIGGEGVILKNVAGMYKADKRNEDILKIKCEVTLDCKVVGFMRGEKGSKYENTLGKLVVEQKNGTQHAVSGMTDAQRNDWFADFDNTIKGKVVEVKAMKILSNGSLREGRYKAVRHDKSVEDID